MLYSTPLTLYMPLKHDLSTINIFWASPSQIYEP